MIRDSKPQAPTIRTWAALLPALLVLAPATAQAADQRLLSRPYDSDQVVRIDGKLGVQATIGFGKDESIQNVAVGDSEKWQITPNKRADLLFVKPLGANAQTNMTVVTDKRTYFFDLVASPKSKPLYMLRFTYKDEPKPPEQPTLALNTAERQVVDGDLAAAPADPATLNFSWERKGDASLIPQQIYDDGELTYLLWAPKQQVPAILVKNAKGEEGPVNYAVRGSTIVISNVPDEIVLRLGKSSATLQKETPQAVPPIQEKHSDVAATDPVRWQISPNKSR